MKLKNLFKRNKISKSIASAQDPDVNKVNPHDAVGSDLNDLAAKHKVSSPYLNARRNWNDSVSSFVTASQLWQFVGIASLLIALASVGGLIYIGSQSKFIPYVVEVDKLGQLQAAGVAKPADVTDDRIMKAIASAFIENARLVTPDVNLQRKAIFSVYSHISASDPSLKKMNEWYNSTPQSNPLARAANEMVSTSITSILQQTKNVWQIDWLETTRDRNGNILQSPVAWRALVTLYVADTVASGSEQSMYSNPLSIYVKDFSWQRLQD